MCGYGDCLSSFHILLGDKHQLHCSGTVQRDCCSRNMQKDAAKADDCGSDETLSRLKMRIVEVS